MKVILHRIVVMFYAVLVSVQFLSGCVLAKAPTAEKQSDSLYSIQLLGSNFIPTPDTTSKTIDSLLKTIEEDSQRTKKPRAHVLVQFWQPVTSEQQVKLSEQGITLLESITTVTYRAALTGSAIKSLAKENSIRWASEVLRTWKADPGVIEGKLYSYQIRANQRAAYTVVFYTDVDIIQAQAVLKTIGLVVETEDTRGFVYNHSLIVQANRTELLYLLDHDYVAWVEAAPPPKKTLNLNSQRLSNVDDVQIAPFNLSGLGVRVGVWDSGTAAAHNDFGGRVTNQDGEAVNEEHATHVTGTIVGDGAGNANAEGMAPRVLISSYGWNWDFSEMTTAATSTGAAGTPPRIQISNHSYGSTVGWDPVCIFSFCNNRDLFGRYENSSREMDLAVRLGLVVVRAAGNDRNDRDPDPTTPPNDPPDCSTSFTGQLGDCILPEAAAKNIITVGAVDRFGAMSGFSGWGPTDDGRIKPDLVADGVDVNSTVPNIFTDDNGDGVDDCPGTYCMLSGTSMATPAVSGIVALMMEQANALNMRFRPSSYKALLIQTARDVGATGPDYQNGWGIADAEATANLLSRDDRPCVREATISNTGNNGVVEFPMCVARNQTETHVTLVWDDPAAAAGDTTPLVNDLDLRLIDPNNNTHTPWTLNPANPSQAATRDGNGANDSINPVEQVSVLNPMVGAWRARVSASALPGGAQVFSVAGVCNPDVDGDGIFDCLDNCPRVSNRDQEDLDFDGVGDICDDDVDGDGVINTADNCSLVRNSDQRDQDGDRIGDVCDSDMDGDGVVNVSDNCITIPNTDQLNTDRDSQGDACDADKDGDCIANALDNCPVTANCNYYASQADHNLCADPCRSALVIKHPIRELVGALVFACTQIPVNPGCFVDGCPWPGFREVPGIDILTVLNQIRDPRYSELTGVIPALKDNVILPEAGSGFINGQPLDMGKILGVKSIHELQNRHPDFTKHYVSQHKMLSNKEISQGAFGVFSNIWGWPPINRDLLCFSLVDELKDQLETANNEYQQCVQNAQNEAAQCQQDINGNGVGDACEILIPRPPRLPIVVP